MRIYIKKDEVKILKDILQSDIHLSPYDKNQEIKQVLIDEICLKINKYQLRIKKEKKK